MPPPTVQVPSIVLPQVWVVGTETETINDLVEHVSIDIPVEYLQEKIIHVFATEVALAPAAVPGNLWCWIELSPVASTISTDYWAAIGGGGGALPALSPVIEVSGLAGAPGSLIHTILLPWSIHSPYARVVVQTPVAAALPNAYWVVQCLISAKTP